MTLFSIAAALWFARLILFIALHLVHSDYDIVSHAVSDYAVGRTRWLSAAMTWVTALAWATLATAVAVRLPHWWDAGGVIVCLVILAVIFAILPVIPTNIEGQALTKIGLVHYAGAIAWFAISYAIMGNFVRLIQHDGMNGLASALDLVQWIALASLIALITALVIKPLRSRIFGISERVFILSVMSSTLSPRGTRHSLTTSNNPHAPPKAGRSPRRKLDDPQAAFHRAPGARFEDVYRFEGCPLPIPLRTSASGRLSASLMPFANEEAGPECQDYESSRTKGCAPRPEFRAGTRVEPRLAEGNVSEPAEGDRVKGRPHLEADIYPDKHDPGEGQDNVAGTTHRAISMLESFCRRSPDNDLTASRSVASVLAETALKRKDH